MNMREALDRTLLLMRDFLVPAVSDRDLLLALTSTKVALVADENNICSHSAQTAFVAAAILMARSGAEIHLLVPETRLAGSQAPLSDSRLLAGLLDLGTDLLPGIGFGQSADSAFDLAVLLGDARWTGKSNASIRINADAWSATITSDQSEVSWQHSGWPFGGLGAAGLAAGEAFKVAMRKLARFAASPGTYAEFFNATRNASIALAPAETAARSIDLGHLDVISGGAIAQAALFALSRIPEVTGDVRVIEPEATDLSNLNRYPLLRRSHIGRSKALDVAALALGRLNVQGIPSRYDSAQRTLVEPFAPAVLVGVDHIPSRWEVQRAQPRWLGIGATTHYSVLVSFHEEGLPCAGCLHPSDEGNQGPIPTVAFVSFWAGLFLAALYVRHASGEILPPLSQQIFFSPLRPEGVRWEKPIAFRSDCPLHCSKASLLPKQTAHSSDSASV